MTFANDGFTSYTSLSLDFQNCHKNTINVALHLITTPIGLIAGLALTKACAGSATAHMIAALYALSLYATVPLTLSLCTTVLILIGSALTPALSVSACVALLAACYVGQDLAHWVTGEVTLQSQYVGAGRGALLGVHVYYLLPLVLDAWWALPSPILSWFVAHNTMFHTTVDSSLEEDLASIRRWVLDQGPSRKSTTHWWYEQLPGSLKCSFARLAECSKIMEAFEGIYNKESYLVERLGEMDEVYVACPKNGGNSDQVFFMRHVDGPYCVWPFCAVYRCVLAVSPNTQVTTSFPQVIYSFEYFRLQYQATICRTRSANIV